MSDKVLWLICWAVEYSIWETTCSAVHFSLGKINLAIEQGEQEQAENGVGVWIA